MNNNMSSDSKILIVGAHGMLGSTLQEAFSKYDVTAWDKEDIDIIDTNTVTSLISELNPDVIINAAAYTAVDDCETNQSVAMSVNGVGPTNLAKAAAEVDAVLIHYSTDYIFNGEKADGYEESFKDVDPVNAYGKSKAAGEEGIQEVAQEGDWDKYYIIRTAWLFGSHGNNFITTMLKLGREKDELSVVNDQHGSPTYTKDLAEQTVGMLNDELRYGVYHITNSGSCTWYEFAKEIFTQANVSVDLQPCATEEFPRPAKRPEYSILINTKLPQLQSWQDAVKEYLHTIESEGQ